MRTFYVISRDLDSFIRAAEEKFPWAMLKILESVDAFQQPYSKPAHFTVMENRSETTYVKLYWDQAYTRDIEYVVCVEQPSNYLDGRRFIDYFKNSGIKIKKMEVWEDPGSPEAAKRRVDELTTLGS